jgi:hypothetical protein
MPSLLLPHQVKGISNQDIRRVLMDIRGAGIA